MRTAALQSEPLTDEEVAARVLTGEKELYEIIMRRYNQRLFRICRTYVDDADDAEDVVQQAYINAYEHLADFQGRAQFSTWLTRIMINEAMRRRKLRQRSIPLAPVVAGQAEHVGQLHIQMSNEDTPEEALMHDELKNVIERTIDELPQKYRSVFVMREIEEMSVAETSDSLGISTANVKVRLNRAKEMLRHRIGKVYRDARVYHFELVRCDRIVAHVLSHVQRY